MIFTLCLFAWWFSGVASFIYWWTLDQDLTLGLLLLAVFVLAVLGPFNFLVGYTVHSRRPIIIMKRR